MISVAETGQPFRKPLRDVFEKNNIGPKAFPCDNTEIATSPIEQDPGRHRFARIADALRGRWSKSGCDLNDLRLDTQLVKEEAPSDKQMLLRMVIPGSTPGDFVVNLLVIERLLACDLSPDERTELAHALAGGLLQIIQTTSLPPQVRQVLVDRTAWTLASLRDVPSPVAPQLVAAISRCIDNGLDPFCIACLAEKVASEAEIQPAVDSLLHSITADRTLMHTNVPLDMPEDVAYDFSLLPEVGYSLQYNEYERTLRRELWTQRIDFEFLLGTVPYEHPAWPRDYIEAIVALLKKTGPKTQASIRESLVRIFESQANTTHVPRKRLLMVALTLPNVPREISDYAVRCIENTERGWELCAQMDTEKLGVKESLRAVVRRKALRHLAGPFCTAWEKYLAPHEAGQALCSVGYEDVGVFLIVYAMKTTPNDLIDKYFLLPPREFVVHNKEAVRRLIPYLLAESEWRYRYFGACLARFHVKTNEELVTILEELSALDPSPWVRAKCEQILAAPENPPGIGWLQDLVGRRAFRRDPLKGCKELREYGRQ